MRTLGDIVYVANALAGGYAEWSQQATAVDAEALRQNFESLIPEIEASTCEMQAVFA